MSRQMKDSGIPWIGEVPDDWNIFPAKGVFLERKILCGEADIHLTPSQAHGVLPQAEYMEQTGNRVVLNLAGSDKMKHVEPNDFIIHLRSFQGGIEFSRHAGKVSMAYTVLTPNGDHVIPTYFRWLLKSSAFISALAATTDQLRDGQSINYQTFGSLRLPVPPAEEQRRIADYLDRETAEIDAFIADQQQLIQLLTERRAEEIRRCVTKGLASAPTLKPSGVDWLGDVNNEWDIRRTRFLVDIRTGSGDTQDANPDGEYPFYVRSDSPERSDSWDFEGEAVLTSGDGAGVGKVFHLVNGKYKAHQRVYLLGNFRQVTASYFYYAFSTFFAEVALDGSAKSTVDSVRRHMLTELPIPLPPLEEQIQIVNYLKGYVHQLDLIIGDAERAIELSRERRAALITAAVTGKIQAPR